MITRFKKFNEQTEIEISTNNIEELAKFSGMEFPSNKLSLSESNIFVKRGKSFNEIINSSSIQLIKILHSAINESTETLTHLLSKKDIKEEIVDFLLKLDSVTLYSLSETIKLLDSLTEYNIIDSINKIRTPSSKEHNKRIIEIINKAK